MFSPTIGSLIGFAALGLVSEPFLSATSRSTIEFEVAPNVRIHAIEAGSDRSKPALLLIPGWGFDASIWHEQIDRFAKERHVVAIDPRSQGLSTKTPEGDTPEQRARDLSKVLDHFALKSVVIVGWSQGVQDVAAYVDQFGTNRIVGIVLVDSPVSSGAIDIPNHPQSASQELGLLAIYSASPEAYIRGMMQAIITRPLTPEVLERLVAQAKETPTAIGEAMLVADMFGADRTPALAKFNRPTLVIASADSDELDSQKAMAAKLPRGRIQIVEKAGHAVFIDQPEHFDSVLAAFMQDL